MSEQPAEAAPSPGQLENKERSRGDGEGDEKSMQMRAEEEVLEGLWHEEKKEGQAEDPESTVKAEAKQAKVQSVFSLVRNQIRVQTGLESRRTGMLQLVQRVTRQLDRSKGDQNGTVPGLEVTSAEEDITTALQEEAVEVEDVPETEEKGKEEGCVPLMQEVLDSVESMRKEVREELSLLRLETQSYTEQALKSLEARLTNTLTTHMMPQALHRPHLAGATDGKKTKALPIPPLVANRRRTLCRTLTTIMPKSCCPPPGLGPRSMSEPIGDRLSDRVSSSSSSSTYTFTKGRDPLGPSWRPLGPLPPTLPPTQQSKKPLRSKARVGKAAP